MIHAEVGMCVHGHSVENKLPCCHGEEKISLKRVHLVIVLLFCVNTGKQCKVGRFKGNRYKLTLHQGKMTKCTVH